MSLSCLLLAHIFFYWKRVLGWEGILFKYDYTYGTSAHTR